MATGEEEAEAETEAAPAAAAASGLAAPKKVGRFTIRKNVVGGKDGTAPAASGFSVEGAPDAFGSSEGRPGAKVSFNLSSLRKGSVSRFSL